MKYFLITLSAHECKQTKRLNSSLELWSLASPLQLQKCQHGTRPTTRTNVDVSVVCRNVNCHHFILLVGPGKII